MIENPIISTPERRYHFEPIHPTNRCGCGNVAKYLVYEDEQPHCQSCFAEAVDGSTMVPVRRFR